MKCVTIAAKHLSPATLCARDYMSTDHVRREWAELADSEETTVPVRPEDIRSVLAYVEELEGKNTQMSKHIQEAIGVLKRRT